MKIIFTIITCLVTLSFAGEFQGGINLYRNGFFSGFELAYFSTANNSRLYTGVDIGLDLYS